MSGAEAVKGIGKCWVDAELDACLSKHLVDQEFFAQIQNGVKKTLIKGASL